MDHNFVDWRVALSAADAPAGGYATFSICPPEAVAARLFGVLTRNVIVAPLEALFEARATSSRNFIDANQVVLAPAGASLQMTFASGRSTARCAIVAIDAPVLAPCWPDQPAIRRRDSVTALNLHLALAEFKRGGDAQHHACEFVHAAVASLPMPASQPPLINRALLALHSNGPAKLSLVHFADALYRESKHLTREFKRARGEPFYRYQRRLRLHHALDALIHGVAITEVALALGFSSHAHFSACFRSCFGMSPSELRKLACGGVQPPVHSTSVAAALAF